MLLESIWFVLVGVLLAGYAILDGFDLGAGMLHLFVAKDDRERRIVINSIAPVWDGNEVWLLTGGGAIFAAFPRVYATVFSGFYLALVLVLVGLMIRAVCLEWRSKEESARWRRGWDLAFAASSALPALLFGVAVGNVLRGLPLDAEQEYAGTFFTLLNPFALICGLLSIAMFVQQGASWLALRTDGRVAERARRIAPLAWTSFVGLWVLATAASLFAAPHLWRVYAHPIAWLAPAAFVAFAVLARTATRAGSGFAWSSASIAALLATAAIGLYPNLVPGLGARGLDLANSASSHLTLSVMLAVALIGMPLVLAYTLFIYTRFRGPVRLDEHSY